MTGLIMGIGQYFGGSQGLTIAFIFAVVMNFGSYWFSDKIVLKMYGGRQVSEADAPQLHRIVHALTVRAGLPMPKLYIIPSQGANAFATGRNPENAAVAITEGILGVMNERELTGVLAHELAHVRRRDHLVRWLEWLACVAFWWNPVAWWAMAAICPNCSTESEEKLRRIVAFQRDQPGVTSRNAVSIPGLVRPMELRKSRSPASQPSR